MRFNFIASPLLGALWMIVLSTTVTVLMSFASGEPFRPHIGLSVLWGGVIGFAIGHRWGSFIGEIFAGAALLALIIFGYGPLVTGENVSTFSTILLPFSCRSPFFGPPTTSLLTSRRVP